ncbi:MAG: hypothetical protein ACXU9W_11330 [Thermodesulfobacteriota bacterium]
MKFLKIWAAVLVMVMALGLGLVGCGGGGAEVRTHSYSTTLGQELKDLEEAYQKGIITEKQYKEAKDKLIEQRTKK